MLQELRAKTHGLVAKILLGLIVITFSFFGVESYFIGQTVDFVAKVGDREISQQDFRTRFDEFRQRQLEAANGAIDAKFFEQPAIKRRILDQLIDEQVLLAANEELGIAVPAQRLREEILKIPAFQRDGNFDPALYRARLSAQGMTPKAFDERIARDLATREIPMGVAMSTFVTDEEINSYLRLGGQLRDIRYVTLAKPELADVKVSEEEIATFYTEHQQDFMNPEQVALDYIEVDAAKLDVNLTPDESTLKERYEKEKSRFVTSEQRLASHILIKVAGSGGPEEQKKALEKAQKIADEARAGKDFAELAKASVRGPRFACAGWRSRLARQGHDRPGVRRRAVLAGEGQDFRPGAFARGLPRHRGSRNPARKDADVRGSPWRVGQRFRGIGTRACLQRTFRSPDRPDL
jgi:peptidyl-prolyl cis-trans isomerase D